MSQNKTIVPGVDYSTPQPGQASPAGASSLADFYSRSAEVDNRTYVGEGLAPAQTAPSPVGSTQIGGYAPQPAMPQPAAPVAAPAGTGYVEEDNGRTLHLQSRVVVGALFSISKGLLGEIFPVYLGMNSIGSGPQCDLCLAEATVQDFHANLVVRRYGGQYTAFFSAASDMDPCEANGMPVGTAPVELEENAVLRIGRHYALLFKIFNIEVAGLTEDPDFQPLATDAAPQDDAPTPADAMADFYGRNQGPSDSGQQRTVLYQ